MSKPLCIYHGNCADSLRVPADARALAVASRLGPANAADDQFKGRQWKEARRDLAEAIESAISAAVREEQEVIAKALESEAADSAGMSVCDGYSDSAAFVRSRMSK